ncbi:MAG TPA: branched-chain amino acid ABC transporter permease [Syntrophomonadaceae bacterium]|nr:branched-chain amino acid ABC transporter permease [Syntrophomonadaceae bacterium]
MKPDKTPLILGILAVALALVYFLPLQIYVRHILILTLLYAFLGTGWNLMCGYAGRLSLGHSAFVAVGAYTSLLLFANFGITPWIGMLAGGVFAVIVMLLIAYPSFRFGVKGPYFTLGSIALAEIVHNLLIYFREYTGGSLGMSLPYQPTSLALFQFDGKEPYYIIILVFWLAAVFLTWKMERTRYYLEAIREDDDAAAALGISVNKNLIIAACISAFLVAIGGTFYVQYYRYIDPYSIAGFTLSLNIALVVVIGGSGTILGPTIGSFLIIPITEILRMSLGASMPGLHLFLYGILLILCIIFLPKGITSIPGIMRAKKAKKDNQLNQGAEGVL